MNLKSILIVSALATVAAASAQVRITEWMYTDAPEYIELTNLGSTSVSMAGWSFDDNSRTAGSWDISGLGSINSHESVILTEGSATDFRTLWGLSNSVKVLGGNVNNLGRADEINIYNGTTLVDRLTFDDANGVGPRTSNVSGNILLANLGKNDATKAVLSATGDTYGSWANTAAKPQIGNPGKYAPVPEPATMAVLGLGLAGFLRRRKK